MFTLFFFNLLKALKSIFEIPTKKIDKI